MFCRGLVRGCISSSLFLLVWGWYGQGGGFLNATLLSNAPRCAAERVDDVFAYVAKVAWGRHHLDRGGASTLYLASGFLFSEGVRKGAPSGMRYLADALTTKLRVRGLTFGLCLEGMLQRTMGGLVCRCDGVFFWSFGA